jgi:carboxypeptidase Q
MLSRKAVRFIRSFTCSEESCAYDYLTFLEAADVRLYIRSMRSALFLVAVFAVISPAYAQQPTPTATPTLYSNQTMTELKRLQKAAYESNYAYRRIAYLSNNIGPRLSGSPQAQRAVDYVADEMRKAGMTVRLQRIMVPVWVRGAETGDIVAWPGMAPGTTQKLALTALGGSIATPPQGITAEVVVVNHFDELPVLGRQRLAGKIVLFNYKFDREMAAAGLGLTAYGQAVAYRFGAAIQAARFGAAAVLVRSAGASQNRLAHTGSMGYDPAVAKIPGAAVSHEDAELIAYLAAQGSVRVKMVLTPETRPDAPSYNVIGEIKGSQRPHEVVVIGGHLDSWDLGTGALDNASGVAVTMQVGFLVNFLKLRPKRTIRIVAFMNEENGGAGSRAYFEEYKNDINNHFAAVESDLGVSHPLGINFAGKPEISGFLAPLTRLLLEQGTTHIQSTGGTGADTAPLTRAGVPSFSPLFDQRMYFNYHHTAADTLDKVDQKHLAELGTLVAVLTYGLANLEVRLPR